MEQSRTQNSKKNIFFALFNYAIKMVLTFVVQKVFISILGYQYLGLNSIFTNVLSILSLAELGFGAAIVFSMYKPMAEGDDEKVKSLLALYKKIYLIVGLIILVIGVAIIPFLPHLINSGSSIPNDISIYWVFVIYLAQTVSSYFFAHRRSLLYVSQRHDIESKVGTFSIILLNSAKLLILYIWPNYYLFIGTVAIFTVIENVIIYIITKKMFPNINNVNVKPLAEEDKKVIKKNVAALIFHKVGTVVVYATDFLVIGKFLQGLEIVGKYGNYAMIITAITSAITLILTAIKGSVGNYIAKSTQKQSLELFQKINFLYSWLIGFCSICLFVLLDGFIGIYYGRDGVLGILIVALLVTNFYLLWSKNLAGMFKECAGIFWQDRFKPIVESIVNLVVSIVLVLLIGLPGVIIGTIVSTLSMPFWVEPYVLYKHYFKKSMKEYWLKFLLYTLITLMIGTATYFACYFIPNLNIWTLLAKFAICAILPNILFVLIYHKTKIFKDSLSYFKSAIFKKSKSATVITMPGVDVDGNGTVDIEGTSIVVDEKTGDIIKPKEKNETK